MKDGNLNEGKFGLHEFFGSRGVILEGAVYRIPLEMIRPFEDQPRKKFDSESLLSLGDSMKESRQFNPILVRFMPDDKECPFLLIDGERRFKAAQEKKSETILAYVITEEMTKDEHFVASVVANFNREGHTPLETAFALRRILDSMSVDEGYAIEKTAKIVGRSKAWVYQHLNLLKLCPEVMDLLEKEKISFQVAVSLSSVTEEAQKKLAGIVVEKERPNSESLRMIRKFRTENPDSQFPGARKITFSDSCSIFLRTIERLNRDAGGILDTKLKAIDLIKFLEKKPKTEVNSIMENLLGLKDNITILYDELSSLLEREKKDG